MMLTRTFRWPRFRSGDPLKRRPGYRLLCGLLGILVLISAPAQAIAQAAASDQARGATAERLLADPLVHGLASDLEREGFQLVPQVVEERLEGLYRVSVLPVEVARPIPPAAPGASTWDRSIPIVVMAMERGGVIEQTAQLRLDPQTAVWITEMRFAADPGVRVRLIDPSSAGPGPVPAYEYWSQMPDGTFDRVIELPDGTLQYESNPDVPVRDATRALTWRCVKNCFLEINAPITWFQVGCMAGCLIGGGIVAIASGGAAAVPAIIACLKICGLAAWITRAAALAACIIACL